MGNELAFTYKRSILKACVFKILSHDVLQLNIIDYWFMQVKHFTAAYISVALQAEHDEIHSVCLYYIIIILYYVNQHFRHSLLQNRRFLEMLIFVHPFIMSPSP